MTFRKDGQKTTKTWVEILAEKSPLIQEVEYKSYLGLLLTIFQKPKQNSGSLILLRNSGQKICPMLQYFKF